MTTIDDHHHHDEHTEPGVTGLPEYLELILLIVLGIAGAVLFGIGLLLFGAALA